MTRSEPSALNDCEKSPARSSAVGIVNERGSTSVTRDDSTLVNRNTRLRRSGMPSVPPVWLYVLSLCCRVTRFVTAFQSGFQGRAVEQHVITAPRAAADIHVVAGPMMVGRHLVLVARVPDDRAEICE